MQKLIIKYHCSAKLKLIGTGARNDVKLSPQKVGLGQFVKMSASKITLYTVLYPPNLVVAVNIAILE